MIENSAVGLVLLRAEVTVTVTREEHHQAVLARYPVAAGAQRRVAVELGWCAISAGKYRGQPAIEVRLDGQRVGELTQLMSQRYAGLVSQVTSRGGRPGCEAHIQWGARGLEVVLRLPRNTHGTIPIPMAPAPPRNGITSRRPVLFAAAAVIAVLFGGALAANDNDSPSTSNAAKVGTSTTAPTTTTTTTRQPTTTTQPTTTQPTTTTTVAPLPTTPAPAPPPVPKPAPKPVAPAPPPVVPEPAPQPACDPNYTGCVPVASDVDCAGGSGNGPAYVRGPIRVIGTDIYDLDRDGDGVACE